MVAGSARHARLVPMAMLVVGQTVFERIFGLQSTLSVMIEFADSVFFLWPLLKEQMRRSVWTPAVSWRRLSPCGARRCRRGA